MEANPRWLTINALAIPGPQIPLPKHPEKLFPMFNPNNDILPKNHINKFILSMNIMNVQHEYVACRLFNFTLQGNASSWFFNLPLGPIMSWQQFKNAFINQFNDDKTSGTLFLEHLRLRIDKKKKVLDVLSFLNWVINAVSNYCQEVIDPRGRLKNHDDAFPCKVKHNKLHTTSSCCTFIMFIASVNLLIWF